ncbi:MAG: DUF4421 family protein [Bacteroidales bacterium]
MRLSTIVTLLFLLIANSTFASADSTRIIAYPKHVHFYTKLGPTFSQVEIQNPDLKDGLLFEPNYGSVLGFGFSYSWFGLDFSVNIPTDEETNQKFGKTQKFDLEMHYTLRRLMVDITLKQYKGFHISNPEEYIDGWNENTDSYPKIPDMETATMGASFAYILSPDKFSSNAAYKFTQSMRRSGGSIILGGFVSLNAMEADSSIVPSSLKQYIDPKLDLKSVAFFNYGISVGYSYLLAIRKKNFVSFTIYPGLAFQKVYQQSSIDGSVTVNNDLALRSIYRLSAGRNGDKYYWGVDAYIESVFINHKSTDLFLNSGHVAIFIGYRLDTSNWRFMKKADRILHPRFLRFMVGNPPNRENVN